MNDARYIAFPLYGIRVATDYPDTNFALFHRASVVSGNALVEFYRSLPAFANSAQAHPAIESLDREATYLLVRTYGHNLVERITNARRRALEVASALSLIVLARTSMNESIGLMEDMHASERYQRTMVNARTGVELLSSGLATQAWVHALPIPPFIVTQNDVLCWVRHASCADLAHAVLNCDSSIPKDCRQRIANACVVLYSALSAPIPEVQFLGAVTVAELLVTDANSAKWDTIKKRLDALVGRKEFNRQGSILHLRNKIIHEGVPCDSGDALLAARLAIEIILSYSRIAGCYKSHHGLVEHLDYSMHMNRYRDDDPRYEPARSIILRPPSVRNDLAIFDIVELCRTLVTGTLGELRVDVENLPAFNQAVAIIAASKVLECTDKEAYSRVVDALTYERAVWSSYSEFCHYYIQSRDRIDQEATLAVARYKENICTITPAP